MIEALDRLAEERIREAIERGDLDGLPGAGQPLDLGEDALVPEELRVAYRLLKNAGFLPEHARLRRELADVEQLIDRAADEGARRRGLRRLEVLRMQLAASPGGERALRLRDLAGARYRARLADRLGGDDQLREPESPPGV